MRCFLWGLIYRRVYYLTFAAITNVEPAFISPAGGQNVSIFVTGVSSILSDVSVWVGGMECGIIEIGEGMIICTLPPRNEGGEATVQHHIASGRDFDFSSLEASAGTKGIGTLANFGSRGILVELFPFVSYDLAEVYEDDSFPGSPVSMSVVEEFPVAVPSYHSARISTVWEVPYTGYFLLTLTCDDRADLWVSDAATPWNATRVAHCPRPTGSWGQ